MNPQLDTDRNHHLRLIVHLLLILVGIVAIEVVLRVAWGEAPKPMQNVAWWQAMGGLMDKHGHINTLVVTPDGYYYRVSDGAKCRFD